MNELKKACTDFIDHFDETYDEWVSGCQRTIDHTCCRIEELSVKAKKSCLRAAHALTEALGKERT